MTGTPREQFEDGLTVGEWHAYMDVIGQHNMYIYIICYLISADILIPYSHYDIKGFRPK